MTFIKTIDIDQADGIVKNEYDKGIRRSGRVFNILKIMSQSPAALKESMRLYLAIIGFSEDAISDAAQVVSYFNYINRIAEGLGVDLENEMK